MLMRYRRSRRHRRQISVPAQIHGFDGNRTAAHRAHRCCEVAVLLRSAPPSAIGAASMDSPLVLPREMRVRPPRTPVRRTPPVRVRSRKCGEYNRVTKASVGTNSLPPSQLILPELIEIPSRICSLTNPEVAPAPPQVLQTTLSTSRRVRGSHCCAYLYYTGPHTELPPASCP